MRSTGLSSLTVVIPTVSRPLFVLRQFKYWRVSDAQVVVLDGAKTPIVIPEDLKSPNIRYLHTGTRFNERLATAGQYVTTPYCAFLPDDEFFLFSGLHAAISRLEADAQIVGCVGRCLGFFVDHGRFLVRDMYREWKPFSDNAISQVQRLDEDLPPNKTHKAQFAILRSSVWASMFKNSYGKYFSCGYTYERLLNLARTILGPSVVLDDLIWMRSLENPPISSESVPRVGGRDFVSWARNPDFSKEVQQYRSIALELLASGGVAPTVAAEFEERFFVGGVHRQATKEAMNRKKLTTRIRHLALNYTPQALRTLAKRYVPNRALKFSGWQGFELDEMLRMLEGWGTRFNHDDLGFVKQLSLELDASVRQAKESTR
jgi:glycosyltransferase domain-containing protein